MGRPPTRVDVLMGIKGLTFDECWKNRVEGDFGGVKTYFLSRAELIVNKRETGRPLDLIDVEALKLAEQIDKRPK